MGRFVRKIKSQFTIYHRNEKVENLVSLLRNSGEMYLGYIQACPPQIHVKRVQKCTLRVRVGISL